MAIKKKSKLKEYIENTHKIRKLSSPPIDDMFPFLDREEYEANKL